jgi:ABC-type transporter Mla subunit MlaD
VFSETEDDRSTTYDETFSSDDSFEARVNESITQFETKLDSLNYDESGTTGTLSSDAKKKVDELKEDSEDLKNKLDRLADRTGDQAENLREEIASDWQEFQREVEEFFTENRPEGMGTDRQIDQPMDMDRPMDDQGTMDSEGIEEDDGGGLNN